MNTQKFLIAMLAWFYITNAHAASISEKFTAIQPQAIDLSALNIKEDYDLIIVHFFAKFCPKCPTEMGWLDTFVGNLKNKKVLVVSLPADIEDQDALKQYCKEHGLTKLEFVLGPALDLAASTGISGVPATLFVKKDTAGYTLIGKARGPIQWDIKEFDKWYKETFNAKSCNAK